MSYPTDDEIRESHGWSDGSRRVIIRDTEQLRMNTFRMFSVINKERAMRWHRGGLDEWSITDWACALAGEVGELCNAVKKMRRVEDRLQGHDGDTPQPRDVKQAVKAIAKEIGDVYAYLDLVAQRFELDTFDCIRSTFNQISEREGLPQHIPEDFK